MLFLFVQFVGNFDARPTYLGHTVSFSSAVSEFVFSGYILNLLAVPSLSLGSAAAPQPAYKRRSTCRYWRRR